MSIRLPVLDQKPVNELAHSFVLNTDSPQISEFDTAYTLSRHESTKMLLSAVEDFKIQENIPGKKIEFLPSVLSNSLYMGKSKFHNQGNILDHSSDTQSQGNPNNKPPQRMSIPLYAPKVLSQIDQRRSLRTHPNPSIFSTNVQTKAENARRSSNLPPIQFINNFPNCMPVQNNLNRENNFSPQLSDVVNEPLSGISTPKKDFSSNNQDISSEESLDEIKSNSPIKPSYEKSTFANTEKLKPRKFSIYSPRNLNKVSSYPNYFESRQETNSEKESNNGNPVIPVFGSTVAITSLVDKKLAINLSSLNDGKSSDFEKGIQKESSRRSLLDKLNFFVSNKERSQTNSQDNLRTFGTEKQNLPQSSYNAYSSLEKPSQFSTNFFTPQSNQSTKRDSASNFPLPSPTFYSYSNSTSKKSQLRLNSEGPSGTKLDINQPKPKRFSFISRNKQENNVVVVSTKIVGRKSCLQSKDPSDFALGSGRARPRKTLKKVKIIAVTKEQKRLRQILWALIYPQLLIKETHKPMEIPRVFIENIEEKIPQYVNLTIDFIKNNCCETLNQLYKESKSMIVVSNEEKTLFGWKKMNSDDIQKRASTMTMRVKAIFEDMIKAIKERKFPSSVIDFLYLLSKEYASVPKNYLFQFELSRLKFDPSGCLRNMAPMRAKMLIGTFFLIRVFVYYFLIHPSDIMPKFSNKERGIRNLKSCSSVLYHILFDYLEKNLKIVPRNQVFVNLKNRVQPTKEKLIGFDNLDKNDESFKGDEIISGLYSKEQLRLFFSTQDEHIDDLTNIIESLLDNLFSAVHEQP